MRNIKTAGLILFAAALGAVLFSCSTDPTAENAADPAMTEESAAGGLAMVAAELGIDEKELGAALGDPGQGAPDFEAAAEKLGISADDLEAAFRKMDDAESPMVDPYDVTINGVDFIIEFEVFTWDELPGDVEYERQPVQSFTDADGIEHWYEAIYVATGDLNWYQAAWLAQDAGGYLACPTSEEENAFVFSLVDDEKYFWHFEEEGEHYGISIGPFLGGYQPEGSEEPAGGWQWISGDEWDWTNWAVNLDDGVIDKDPRDNSQPNDSGDGQPIMGFGELNVPVPTWGDYMETVGTYGLKKSPGDSYGFIIEYESDPS